MLWLVYKLVDMGGPVGATTFIMTTLCIKDLYVTLSIRDTNHY